MGGGGLPFLDVAARAIYLTEKSVTWKRAEPPTTLTPWLKKHPPPNTNPTLPRFCNAR